MLTTQILRQGYCKWVPEDESFIAQRTLCSVLEPVGEPCLELGVTQISVCECFNLHVSVMTLMTSPQDRAGMGWTKGKAVTLDFLLEAVTKPLEL